MYSCCHIVHLLKQGSRKDGLKGVSAFVCLTLIEQPGLNFIFVIMYVPVCLRFKPLLSLFLTVPWLLCDL